LVIVRFYHIDQHKTIYFLMYLYLSALGVGIM